MAPSEFSPRRMSRELPRSYMKVLRSVWFLTWGSTLPRGHTPFYQTFLWFFLQFFFVRRRYVRQRDCSRSSYFPLSRLCPVVYNHVYIYIPHSSSLLSFSFCSTRSGRLPGPSTFFQFEYRRRSGVTVSGNFVHRCFLPVLTSFPFRFSNNSLSLFSSFLRQSFPGAT